MIVTAHAACKGHAPENTLAGIRAALKHKAALLSF
jgi:glycerophosphoryl diester phosphodiesterase